MLLSDETKGVIALAVVGAMVGLGQLLASTEKLTKRIVIGRALSSAGLGASAAAVVGFLPDMSLAGQMGIAAALASLGTSGIERLLQKILNK